MNNKLMLRFILQPRAGSGMADLGDEESPMELLRDAMRKIDIGGPKEIYAAVTPGEIASLDNTEVSVAALKSSHLTFIPRPQLMGRGQLAINAVVSKKDMGLPV
jgi:hypothetical protein